MVEPSTKTGLAYAMKNGNLSNGCTSLSNIGSLLYNVEAYDKPMPIRIDNSFKVKDA